MSAVTSQTPASQLFIQPFVQALIKENIKASRHWLLWEEFTGDRWIPLIKGHLMTSSWSIKIVSTKLIWHWYSENTFCTSFLEIYIFDFSGDATFYSKWPLRCELMTLWLIVAFFRHMASWILISYWCGYGLVPSGQWWLFCRLDPFQHISRKVNFKFHKFQNLKNKNVVCKIATTLFRRLLEADISSAISGHVCEDPN